MVGSLDCIYQVMQSKVILPIQATLWFIVRVPQQERFVFDPLIATISSFFLPATSGMFLLLQRVLKLKLCAFGKITWESSSFWLDY